MDLESCDENSSVVVVTDNESLLKTYFIDKMKAHSSNCKNIFKKPWDVNKVQNVINELKSARLVYSTGEKKTCKQYHLFKKYDLINIGGTEHLVFKRKNVDDPTIYIVPFEKYFDILRDCHRNTGHGGRDKMLYQLKSKYNIPRSAVEIFVSLCKECNLKKSQNRKGMVVRPILSKDFNTRGQVDLIDLQSSADGEYKWLLNYQDHATKYLHLRPLRTKRAAEVAIELVKIFLEFGAPHILQSDNGREFTASVIQEIMEYWPDCRIVHGRPRHPQSQGSVERSNQDVENMLRAWMADSNSTHWSFGCYFVQWQKNASLHRIIGRTPYRAVFGSDPRVGLKSTNLPESVIKQLRTEEDLENIYNKDTLDEIKNSSEQRQLSAEVEISQEVSGANQIQSEMDRNVEKICNVCSEEVLETFLCATCKKFVHLKCCYVPSGSSHTSSNMECIHCNTEKNISKERSTSYIGQKRAAQKMIETTNKKFCNLKVGTCVTVNVPKFDRDPLDSRNILGKVIETKNGLYKIGTDGGIIKNWLPRSDIQKCQDIHIGEIPQSEITLRKAVAKQSKFAGQGFQKCICKPSKNQCLTKKCACAKNGALCSSKCHSSVSCTNK